MLPPLRSGLVAVVFDDRSVVVGEVVGDLGGGDRGVAAEGDPEEADLAEGM